MTFAKSLAAASLAALYAASASAVEAEAAMADAAADETIVVLAPEYRVPVITSGTKTDTALRDIPQSITVLTRDLIDDQAMRSIADVLRYVPGGQVAQGEGHRDQIVLRGNNTTADFFVDGLRDDVQYYRDLYNAERIEVLKGPNAMIFGRGGGGGVVNRVIKKADGELRREATLQFGSYDQYRGMVDLGGAVTDAVSLRLNGFYENSDSYRDFVDLERFGLNPTATFRAGEATTLRLTYEHVEDDRTVDRGGPSAAGRPFERDRSQFYGNPDLSFATTDVDLVTAGVEHEFSADLKLRAQLLYGDYDKFYQNVFASSAVNTVAGVQGLELAAYNSGTDRENLFVQTDVIWQAETGPIGHTLLVGVEFGRQETTNLRNEGRFPTTTLANPERLRVTAADPVSFAPVQFTRASQNNDGVADVAAVYIQDQIDVTDQLKLVAGLRYDRFELDFRNNLGTGSRFERGDDLWSPRGGIIYKPVEPVSFYASYSRSYLPQSGDQFSTLDLTAAALKPERFENIEAGVKWDLKPGLALTAAAYRLDRDNTRAPGATPGTTVLTGSQRSKGLEFGLSGAITSRWEVLAGLALQEAEITSTTSAAPKGREIALVPETTFSLWSSYRPTPRFGFGAGVTSQSKSFASISNAVVLPGYTRVDAALFFVLTGNLKAQVNLENLLDERYYGTAHNDNNILPGSPRAVRLSLTGRF
jgi:catecholate siderophore receptor